MVEVGKVRESMRTSRRTVSRFAAVAGAGALIAMGGLTAGCGGEKKEQPSTTTTTTTKASRYGYGATSTYPTPDQGKPIDGGGVPCVN